MASLSQLLARIERLEQTERRRHSKRLVRLPTLPADQTRAILHTLVTGGAFVQTEPGTVFDDFKRAMFPPELETTEEKHDDGLRPTGSD